MIKITTSIKIFLIATVFFSTLILGITYYSQRRCLPQKKNAVVVVGVPKERTGILVEVGKASEQYQHIEIGEEYLKKGKIDEAIQQFNIGLSKAISPMAKGEAIVCLANAYEKMLDYKKALEYMLRKREKYIADWAKEPVIERIKYLEYALQGEYELAVEHARKALEADVNVPGSHSPKTGRSDYIDRLYDIIAAKEHIESLKKQ